MIQLGASIQSSSINKEINPKMPYLSFLAINYNIPVIVEVQKWFEGCLVRNYANPIVERSLMVFEKQETKQNFIFQLNDIGIDISDYHYDRKDNKIYLQRMVNHQIFNLSFNEEAEGTKKIFAALPVIRLALEDGRLLIIDELDAKLHPKLLRYIISLFTNPKINQKGSQLIFTSHDVSTMKNDVFRRDEIWFAALDSNHSSEIYSLYEIRREDKKRVNNTAAYDKQYLEGRYGAI